jgi:hypothetical protein
LSSGVHDDLRVLAVSVRDDVSGDHVVVVCFDGISVPPSMVSDLEVGPDIRIVAVASHTHASPSLEAWDQGVMGPFSHDVQDRVVAECRRAALGAVGAEQPGRVLVGTAPLLEPVGTNRRNPAGRRDEIVRLVEVRDDADSPLAILVVHGCHPTVLSAANTLASADLVWGVRKRVAAALPGVPVAYLPGGAGDQSTRHTRRDSSFDEVVRLGGVLGDATVVARSSSVVATRSEVRQATFTLGTRPVPSLDDARRQWEYWTRETERRVADGEDPSSCRQAEVELIGANHHLRRAEAGLRLPEEVAVSVTRWDLGDVALAFWPVEPTIELALALEEQHRTWLCGYASGYLGYLLAEADCARGGYEVAASMFECGAAVRFAEVTRSLASRPDT